jgi:hypothetical protein
MKLERWIKWTRRLSRSSTRNGTRNRNGLYGLGGDDMDMTAASDDDVIAIYKLSGEDEIEIVGDDIHLNINEPGEYVVKVQPWVVKVKRITAEELPMGDDEMGDESGMDYEIEMGDDEELGSDDSDMVGDEAPVDGGEEEV